MPAVPPPSPRTQQLPPQERKQKGKWGGPRGSLCNGIRGPALLPLPRGPEAAPRRTLRLAPRATGQQDMGRLPARQNRPGLAGMWRGLFLAASVLSACLQLGQAGFGLTIRREPVALDLGSNVTLLVLGIPPSLLICSWYRGAEAGNATTWILSYAPAASPQRFYGPAYTGREVLGPSCSLHITGLRASDAGSYALNVQVPGYNKNYSMSISFSARRFTAFLAVVVAVPVTVLVCVALLVTIAICRRRRNSGASSWSEPPGERTGIIPK
ncbi:uncharacterized protein LOC142003489 [Carettochelys insculpta]|uniref:uncharacterized protein LOC142003489 n=1 Tax=Carettochelys insculpta TaxID=44489 RepID=UPI003EBF0882